MKKLFFAAIPICLVSFILFGISAAILGTKYVSYPSSNSSQVVDYGERLFVDEIVTSASEWTLEEVKSYVELHTSGVNTYVVQSDDEQIHLRVASGGTKVSVQASCEGDRLTVTISPPNIIFDSFADFGKILWDNDIFNPNSNVEAVIAFPKLIYDELHVMHGSGTLMIDGFNAYYNDFDIGSGRFEYSKSDQFTANRINLDLGSGRAVLNNAQTTHYDIDIGSGSFEVSGLSGYGEINMGTGSGSIAYEQFTDDGETIVDIGSGIMNLYFPDNGGCELYPSIGSGSISIDAYGIQKKLTINNDEDITLGSGGSIYVIEMGSGKVNIKNTSEYTAPEMFSSRPDIPKFPVITGIEITDNTAMVVEATEYTWEYSDPLHPGTGSVATTSMPKVDSETVPPESSSSSPTYAGEYGEAVVPPDPPEAPVPPEAPEAPEAPEPPVPGTADI